jgi:ribosomal protein L11 methyltransferase
LGELTFPAIEIAWPRRGDGDPIVDLLYAALDDFQPIALEPRLEAPSSTLDLHEIWRVFFRSSSQRDHAATALRAQQFTRRLTRIVAIEVPDDGWARRSQENLRAVRAGRIVVAPPWDASATSTEDLSVVIDPSTGFGTGHHETTRLCLMLLQQVRVAGRDVIDVGTGSGVLAIAAATLGAARVTAVDNDPEALRNARENVARNQCEDVVDLLEADLGSLSLPSADIVTANLTAAVLERFAQPLLGLVRSGGTLVISGVGPHDVEALAKPFAELSIEETLHEGGWTAQRLQRPP